MESIKVAAAKVAQDARSQGGAGEALASLADQLVALTDQVAKVKRAQISI
jgi:hypothetical protein